MTTKKLSPGAYIVVDSDGWTGGMQLSIDWVGQDGDGVGYRLAGPKFNGSSSTIMRHRLSERDIAEIQRYLDLSKAAIGQAA